MTTYSNRRADSNRRRGEAVTHCPKGHEYTAENTYVRVVPGKNWVLRHCRTCDRDRKRATARAAKIRETKYGLQPGEYAALVWIQDNRCAICDADLGESPQVDHDHATGVVRGLLCRGCNTGLGFFADDAELVRTAARYLDLSP